MTKVYCWGITFVYKKEKKLKICDYFRTSLVAQKAKKPSAIQKAQIQSLGWEDPLEIFPGEGNGYPLQFLAWKIPWAEEPVRLQSMGSQRVGQDWTTNTFIISFSSVQFSSVQYSSVTHSCPTLCDPMNCSTPGLPVHHQLLEFTQTHVHRASDAIQPSHPLSSPSPPAPNPSQHQSLFQWVNSSHEVAKVLEFSALASFLPKKSQGWSPSVHGVAKS